MPWLRRRIDRRAVALHLLTAGFIAVAASIWFGGVVIILHYAVKYW